MNLISIIVPCYGEEAVLPLFHERIGQIKIDGAEFEYVLVNDGSKDGTLDVMKRLAAEDSRVKYVSFSRNFGKEAAMYAGLTYARGDYVAIMDADLQDPPELLYDMYREVVKSGHDCAAARRTTRKGESPVRSFFARCFYKLINKISKTEIVDGARDFRLMTRQMADSILELTEYNRFSKGIFSWVGYDTVWLDYENVERAAGETKWSFWSLFKYSLEGMAAFSTAPLAVSSFLGILFCLLSVVGIIFTVVRQLIWRGSAFGWPSLVCIVLLVGGAQLFCMGIIGQYLAKTYLEVKNRPVFIVKETNQQPPSRD